MEISQLMQFVDASKHLANVEFRVFFFEHARVVEEGAEIAAWNVFHGEIDELGILERVEQPYEPWSLRRGKDVAFYEDMTDLNIVREAMDRGWQRTSSILNNVRFLIFLSAHTSPVSCLRARKTSP